MTTELLEKFEHEFISIEPLSKKHLKVDIITQSRTWEDFLDKSLDYSKDHKCWVLAQNELKDFIELLKNVEEESEEDESDESSTDDEEIKKALTRRLKSESKQVEIEESHVSDSELEDTLSVVRRIRGLYKRIRGLEKRIEFLETKHI
jgi:flagellar biosynthesis component FlhA